MPMPVLGARHRSVRLWSMTAVCGMRNGAGTRPNARDFRCFRLFGMLWSSCPVSVLVPVFPVALAVSGNGGCPRVAAGLARGSTVRVPRRAGGSSFLTGCFPGGG